MTIKEKNEMAAIAVETMTKEYGFAPAKKQIVLLECGGNKEVGFDYIMFAVSGKSYTWQINKHYGVWEVTNVIYDKEWVY